MPGSELKIKSCDWYRNRADSAQGAICFEYSRPAMDIYTHSDVPNIPVMSQNVSVINRFR